MMRLPTLTRKLTWLGRFGRIVLKRFIYAQLAIFNGLKIVIGKEQPLIRFTVENDPPSVYWVFRLKSSEIPKLNLPPQFTPCPIRCLTSSKPEYLLTLNVYRVSGLVNGLRAEWSTYVQTGDGVSRYIVIDAQSSTYSMDPVNVITKKSHVAHARAGNTITTQLGQGQNTFAATITLPAEPAPIAPASNEWVTANDAIYWGNGIRDHTFYNAGLANARQRAVDGAAVSIHNHTPWAALIEPNPLHVLLFDDPIEFVVSPWENVDSVALNH